MTEPTKAAMGILIFAITISVLVWITGSGWPILLLGLLAIILATN